jgi:hypothetical protein
MQIRLSIPRATMPVSMKGTYGTTLFCWFLKCYQSDSWLRWNFSGIFVLMEPRDIVQRKIIVVHSSCIDLSQRQCCIRMQSTPQMRQILHATTINDPDSSHKYWENSLKKNQTGDAGRSSSAITELDPSWCSLNFMERNRNWCERFAHRPENGACNRIHYSPWNLTGLVCISIFNIWTSIYQTGVHSSLRFFQRWPR